MRAGLGSWVGSCDVGDVLGAQTRGEKTQVGWRVVGESSVLGSVGGVGGDGDGMQVFGE